MNRGRIVAATSGAFAVASALLITTILPAEYGWDPLGTGAAMGLVGMGAEGDSHWQEESRGYASDIIAFKLLPFESVEYKYRLKAGSAMLFHWQAQGEVVYELHAEPDGAAPGFSESYLSGRSAAASGHYVADFDGIHGWFWQNRGQQEITVTLSTQGFYTKATEFRDGGSVDYRMQSQPLNRRPSQAIPAPTESAPTSKAQSH